MDLTPRTENAYFGKVRYDKNGLPMCLICGASHLKLMTHVYQVHGIRAKDYKIMYGLDVRKGIVAESTREKLRRAFEENYDTAVSNLLQHGSKYRFKPGTCVRAKMFSAQSRNRLAITNQVIGQIRKLRNDVLAQLKPREDNKNE